MPNHSMPNESNLDMLEAYFKKYPDMPKETILKRHLLRLAHWFSGAAGIFPGDVQMPKRAERNLLIASSTQSEVAMPRIEVGETRIEDHGYFR
jgi:hypothetical protein